MVEKDDSKNNNETTTNNVGLKKVKQVKTFIYLILALKYIIQNYLKNK